jgi:hypothetical protein
MLSIRLLLISSLVISLVTPAVAQDVKPESREALETAIPEGIRLLEAKEYKVFVEIFVPPADLKKIIEGSSLEEFAKKFGERKAPRLLEILKEIKGTKPSLDDNGTEATFSLKEEKDGKKSITFVKIDKYWYIKN